MLTWRGAGRGAEDGANDFPTLLVLVSLGSAAGARRPALALGEVYTCAAIRSREERTPRAPRPFSRVAYTDPFGVSFGGRRRVVRVQDGSRRVAPSQLQATLRSHNVRPNKALGQHFLLDLDVVEDSLRAAHVGPDDVVLEIGPGPGVLTEELARVAGRVVAVEVDRAMLRVLAPLRRRYPNLTLVEGNVLRFPPTEFVGEEPYKVVANLPYYLTSAAIRHFLEAEHRPRLMVLLLQREVAERVCAQPGDMGLLSLSVQLYADPEILRRVPASSFYPAPKVESALIRIRLRARPRLPVERIPLFFRLAQAGFADRRKQLHNALRINLQLAPPQVEALLAEADIDGKRRAETLSMAEWGRLTEAAEGVVRVPAPAAGA